MVKRQHKSSASSTKRIRIGTSLYSTNGGFTERLVPYIRLRGDWLSNAGFEPNEDVVIRITRGRLVITPA
ncbi:type I toxin-antitoxin system SymE family toxin [Tahibacter soli]|uniref:Type I toxin-antitoxin system SymE family toxin n=1 Tax=Tahibacter soli TaxID=2983605 RepID=A0A9X3YGZ8_9GAMM|nr:type I toxin-antitoxin system SymE family toxin [Tahibacter soli]MDC8012067.1 type I toxin-antitoxin system SymE family toxin [Tahibacter soli]